MLEGFVKVPILGGNSFLSVTDNGLKFNKNVVKHIQKAEYVIVLVNEDKKQIAIQKCDKNTESSVPFYRNEKNLELGVRLNNHEVQQLILSMMDWNVNNFNYRADGFVADNGNTVIFDLGNARKLSRKKRQKYKTRNNE